MRLLHHISRELIFKQVFALGIELRVQFNLSGAPLNFFSPPWHLWHFGASMFTEMGGDDNRVFLNLTSSRCTLHTWSPKYQKKHHQTVCKVKPYLCLDLWKLHPDVKILFIGTSECNNERELKSWICLLLLLFSAQSLSDSAHHQGACWVKPHQTQPQC